MNPITISSHAGFVYYIDHNNRIILSENLDLSRIQNNLYLVAASENIPTQPISNLNTFIQQYFDLADYWDNEQRNLSLFQQKLDHFHTTCAEAWQQQYHDAPTNWATRFLCTVALPSLLLTNRKSSIFKKAFTFCEKATQEDLSNSLSLKQTFQKYPNSSSIISIIDNFITWSKSLFKHHLLQDAYSEKAHVLNIDDIYNALFENSFQDAQAKLRPCRRYDGSCLSFMRSHHKKRVASTRQGQRNEGSIPAEAFEIEVMLGNMHTCGYVEAPENAAKAEELLTDLTLHLLSLPYVAVITSESLKAPEYKPPFSHGLILLNSALHCDEANPGLHLTFIPYASDCPRGARIQPSRNMAMAGLGYPYELKPVLDDAGNPILRLDRDGNPKTDKRGNPCYVQEYVGEGFYGWLEKTINAWLEKEMLERFDWHRAEPERHKHGHLSTSEYKLKMTREQLETSKVQLHCTDMKLEEALSRLAETNAKIRESDDALEELQVSLEIIVNNYRNQLQILQSNFIQTVNQQIRNSPVEDIVFHYLKRNPRILHRLYNEIISNTQDTIKESTQSAAKSLDDLIQNANTRRKKQVSEPNKQNFSKSR